MKNLPALLHRPGGVIAVGLAAWPVLAYSAASAVGTGGCVRAHGLVGFMATHGSLMRETPTCPSTSVGLTGPLENAMTVIVILATLAALLHIVIASVGSQLQEWVGRVGQAIARLIAPALPAVKHFVNARVLAVGQSRSGGGPRHNWGPWRRGPPVMVPAAA